MIIKVKFYAICRDLSNMDEAEIELPGNMTVGSLLQELIHQFPDLDSIASRVAVAVNNCYVRKDHILNDGDEISLIPPVSGG